MHNWLFEHRDIRRPVLPPGLQSLGFRARRIQQHMKGMDMLALVQADITEAAGLGIHAIADDVRQRSGDQGLGRMPTR